MKKSRLILSVVLVVGFPLMTSAFEGIVVQRSTHTASDVNAGQEAMEKMMQRIPPQQRKMMEERMKESMKPGSVKPEVSTQTMYIKGSRMRMDFDREKGDERTFAIMDMEERVVRNFFLERKVYMEMSLDEVEEMGKGILEMRKRMGKDESENAAEMKKTTEKKEISGYDCQLYIQKEGQYVNEYWITEAITIKEIMGGFADRMKSFGKAGGVDGKQEALMKIGGYPILTVTRNRYGTNRNEVIRIEKKRLSDDMFAVPDGYQKQTMQDMMAPKR